jgi:hypothetical protein
MIGGTASHRLSSAVAAPDGLPPSAQRLVAPPGKLVACMRKPGTILNAMLGNNLHWNPQCT